MAGSNENITISTQVKVVVEVGVELGNEIVWRCVASTFGNSPHPTISIQGEAEQAKILAHHAQ